MIEALLSFLSGGGVRLAQSYFGLKEKKLEAEHEYKMLALNIELDKNRAAAELARAEVDADALVDKAEIDALIAGVEAQAKPSGIRWIDALSASVRPVAFYFYCIASYSAYKAFLIARLLEHNAPLDLFIAALWTGYDVAVSSSILAFFLVDRSLRKLGRA